MSRRTKLRMLLPAILLLAGCAIYDFPGMTDTANAPIIQGVAPNPSAVAGPNDVITFTVTATSPDGSPLSYTWSATKGTLSANKGELVSWTPKNPDGSIAAGLATVTLLVTNGSHGSSSSQVNLMINSNGSAQVVGTTAAATASPSPRPSATSSVTATSSANP